MPGFLLDRDGSRNYYDRNLHVSRVSNACPLYYGRPIIYKRRGKKETLVVANLTTVKILDVIPSKIIAVAPCKTPARAFWIMCWLFATQNIQK